MILYCEREDLIMNINQEIFDKTNLTEIDILKNIPKCLSNFPTNSSVNSRVKHYILNYKISQKYELEVEYVGMAETLENRGEIIRRARKIKNDLQSVITFNYKIPDKDSRLTNEQIDLVRKTFNMFEKLKEEEYIEIDGQDEQYHEELF